MNAFELNMQLRGQTASRAGAAERAGYRRARHSPMTLERYRERVGRHADHDRFVGEQTQRFRGACRAAEAIRAVQVCGLGPCSRAAGRIG